MLTEQLIAEKLRIVKPLLMKQFHVLEIGYFGSYAKGNATDKSDLDILIEFSEPIGWDFFKVQDILEESLGIKIDLVTKRAILPQRREIILQQLKYV